MGDKQLIVIGVLGMWFCLCTLLQARECLSITTSFGAGL